MQRRLKVVVLSLAGPVFLASFVFCVGSICLHNPPNFTSSSGPILRLLLLSPPLPAAGATCSNGTAPTARAMMLAAMKDQPSTILLCPTRKSQTASNKASKAKCPLSALSSMTKTSPRSSLICAASRSEAVAMVFDAESFFVSIITDGSCREGALGRVILILNFQSINQG